MSTNKEIARRWFDEVWNQRRTESIAELTHPECIGHHEGHTSKGHADLRVLQRDLLSMVPDLKVVVEAIVAEGDEVVVRWTAKGSSAERPVTFSGITWMRIAEGKIMEGWDRWNQAALVQYLAAA